MKALFLSAAIAMASMSCFAQASDHATIRVGLCLTNIIDIDPPCSTLVGNFDDEHDYDHGVILKNTKGDHDVDYKVSSNRDFNVTIKAGSANFSYLGTGTDDNVMPCSVLKYHLLSNNTGGTNATPSFWNALTVAPAPVINGGEEGRNKRFSLQFKADPGWNYTGGLYGLDVIVTATQL
ncbi:MAG: hypothetical protein JO154_01725 [Chitinophaga sp.]|uniref:hypothetical protein n=1 Tax=Chitinophaga sp. TaxID=1869181 RepID=UPI0025BEDA26|nr:hypothetical protein [Chitinophaga sp.]MBV8251298.1 hypothetical protein [Chitinophaga sp.]